MILAVLVEIQLLVSICNLLKYNMLQFIAKEGDLYSIPEQVQMAIEGGCLWVQLDAAGMSDSAIRELASELIPLCRETSTMLTILGHVMLAKELAIHGVLLHASEMPFAEAREVCGPEAIIGMWVDNADDAAQYKDADVDYLALPANLSVADLELMVPMVRRAAGELPLVAFGDYELSQVEAVMHTGVNGIALGKAIVEASDPVVATENIIKELKVG